MAQGLGIFLASLVTALVGVATIFIKYHLENKALKKKIKEINKRKRFDVSLSLDGWIKYYKAFDRLKANTCIDNFFLFQGENGGGNPMKITSAVFYDHKDNIYKLIPVSAIDTYKNVKVDNHYVDLFAKSERTMSVNYLDVTKMEDSMLRRFYLNEGVKHSAVAFQKRYTINPTKAILLFFSVRTYREFNFSEAEKLEIESFARTIQSLNYVVNEVVEITI